MMTSYGAKASVAKQRHCNRYLKCPETHFPACRPKEPDHQARGMLVLIVSQDGTLLHGGSNSACEANEIQTQQNAHARNLHKYTRIVGSLIERIYVAMCGVSKVP